MTRPDISRDQLRRELRTDRAAHRAEAAAARPVLEALLTSDADADQRVTALFGRRRFLTVGGLTVATAGLLAACAEEHNAGIARVGNAPTATALPDAIVNDVVLLRTASSVERSAIAVYDTVLDNGDLLDQSAYGDIVKQFREDHVGHAELFEDLTRQLGGEPWTCSNPRFDDVVIGPILRAIAGGPKTDLLAETPVSDDPRRDVLNFAHALETVAGETYQGLLPVLSTPDLRKAAITIGAQEARHAALLAIAIMGRPAGYAPALVSVAAATTTTAAPAEGDAPVATKILPVYAMPGTFGLLSQVQLVVGKPNEAGTRLTVNIETPSLNSFVYEYMAPSC